MDKENNRKTSTSYTYKYDFSKEGITGIKISYAYNGEEQTKYIPVKVVSVRMADVIVDLNETKTEYQYGDEFELPILKQTMTDGMNYSFQAERDSSNCQVINIPNMIDYGEHEVTILYENYVLTYTVKVAQKVVDETASQLKIQTRTAVAGGNVIVQFSFANMPEIKSMLFHNFVFDRDKLEIVEGRWKADGIIADWEETETKEMATFTFGENQSVNGFVFELELKVKDTCPAGEYTVSCSALVNATDENGYDKAIMLDVAPGGVSVIDDPRGDFNKDGIVDDNDAIYLLRYTMFGGAMFDITQSGDVNGDDIVNSDDAIYLLRHYLFEEDYPLYW